MYVEVCAPTRIDLAGGTLDIQPLPRILKASCTVNVGVSLFSRCKVSIAKNQFRLTSIDQQKSLSGDFSSVCQNTKLPLFGLAIKHFWNAEWPPLDVECNAESPAGAGIGGSSSLILSLCSSLAKLRHHLGLGQDEKDEILVNKVKDIETSLIKVPAGCQDYWGALMGGVNILTFPPGGERVEHFEKGIEGLGEKLILVNSGTSRNSGINNWEIFQSAFSQDTHVLSFLDQIGQAAVDCSVAVQNREWEKVIELSAKEWGLRTRLWPRIETEKTRALSKAAVKAGAQLVRVCGAGGGGVLAVFAEKERHAEIEQAISRHGGSLLAARVVASGLKAIYDEE